MTGPQNLAPNAAARAGSPFKRDLAGSMLPVGDTCPAQALAQEASVEITKPPPGDWGSVVVLLGKGTDGNLYETKTSDGKTWTNPSKV
jgi:hypothetical protein